MQKSTYVLCFAIWDHLFYIKHNTFGGTLISASLKLKISSWSKNTAIWLDKKNCCDKLSIDNKWKVSSFHFIFHYILFSVTLLEKPVSTRSYGKFGWNAFPLLTICLHAKNKCNPVIPSADICDYRILQSNWLKAFLAIIQEQAFPQIWDLYNKIDNNINFYLSTFTAKINDKIFQRKNPILGSFLSIFCRFWPKGVFPKKSS